MNIMNNLNAFELMRTKMVDFKKGDTIFREDEKCDSIGIIENGSVEISTYLESGEKIVYNTLGNGEMFGTNLIFSSQPIYKGNVVALEDSKIHIIRKDDLKVLLLENEKFLIQYLNIQSDFTKKLNFKIKLLSMDSARDRIMFALANSKNGTIRIQTVSDFGESLGLTREATSRTISKLSNEGIISYENKILKKIK